MNRDRNYYRKMRNKHIRRKKRLSSYYHWNYRADGMYNKGKIHCSCKMCSMKTNNRGKNGYHPSKNWKHSDLVKIQKMKNEIKEYNDAVVE